MQRSSRLLCCRLSSVQSKAHRWLGRVLLGGAFGVTIAVTGCADGSNIPIGQIAFDQEIFEDFELNGGEATIGWHYTFFVTLVLFRTLFSYTRWVFPKVEIETDATAKPIRHRAIWGAILLALVGPAAYDFVRFIVGHIVGFG
jgi:hypothetical protein